MDYDKFVNILNKHIFDKEKSALIENLANYPYRFLTLFRPSKPYTKILQHILQSHEIKFGDAFEEILSEILHEIGYELLEKNIRDSNGKKLSLDQHFRKNDRYYFIEQKIRDDHDSTKKRGQIDNFRKKLDILYSRYEEKLVAIMYFIDPSLYKNKNYYLDEIEGMKDFYDIEIYLLYGKELFDFFGISEMWDNILSWLKTWRDKLPEIPEIDYDREPEKTFNIIKEVKIGDWKKILYNDDLWEKGLMKIIFKKGDTLKLLLDYFKEKNKKPYKILANKLEERLSQYYGYKTKRQNLNNYLNS